MPKHLETNPTTWTREKYKENEEIKLYCGMIDALAFLPPKDVKESVEFLWGTSPFELYEILYYFDTTYVSGVMGADPKPPLYPPEVWNVHHATLSNKHRTNNVCESWNNKFNTLVGNQHPTIWNVREAIQKDESTERAVMLGNQPDEGRKKKSLLEHQDKLKDLCQDYISGNRNMESFLKAIGSRIRFH